MLFVYARVTATVSDEQGNSRIVAWSGKSDVFSLEAGMVETISMRVSRSTFVEFYCTGIPDKATIGANGITTVVIQEDDASAVSWYVTITIAYEDGRVITAPIVNVGNLYIALNDEVKYNAYVDSCLGASVTIKCYSIDSYQFDALAEPISETHLAETIENIVSSGPKYYGTTSYSTPTERIVISMHE